MLRTLKDLEGYNVTAVDGEVGKVVDFLLDDQRWVIRYLVVQTGRVFLSGARVLISPISFQPPQWGKHAFPVNLTMEKVKNSPGVDVDKPVSRQHERAFSGYYAYPFYWGFMQPWGIGTQPALLATVPPPPDQDEDSSNDVHLRSAREVRGYHIQGTDDGIGHVTDFIVDDESWEVRYLVVDTRGWWFGKHVLIAPQWATRIDWAENRVHVDMSRDNIKNSPAWSAEDPVNRDYEARLYDYHGRPVYWADDRAVPPPIVRR
ncbi:MAG TPA: PRC-barrel domain-containing protein [Polyangia bacterium]|jgi:uncharacterized protein YrrD